MPLSEFFLLLYSTLVFVAFVVSTLLICCGMSVRRCFKAISLVSRDLTWLTEPQKKQSLVLYYSMREGNVNDLVLTTERVNHKFNLLTKKDLTAYLGHIRLRMLITQIQKVNDKVIFGNSNQKLRTTF